MFVVHADVERDEDNPAVLYGYGGFEISQTPSFRRYALSFLERGGVFAVANLRGGGEFGEAWHHAAREERKQNTFDDFVTAAEHLADRDYTRPERHGIDGRSNGGLTVGAAITQRPDLFAACLCVVPLLDMLRSTSSYSARRGLRSTGRPTTARPSSTFKRTRRTTTSRSATTPPCCSKPPRETTGFTRSTPGR
jgi:prolyl oligopeptidase PreP (S9A serine peptidase family)